LSESRLSDLRAGVAVDHAHNLAHAEAGDGDAETCVYTSAGRSVRSVHIVNIAALLCQILLDQLAQQP
jgi:hypothetical protein